MPAARRDTRRWWVLATCCVVIFSRLIGPPIWASTTFRPAMRKKVLLPAMLEPEMTQVRVRPPRSRSLATTWIGSISGCMPPSIRKHASSATCG